MSMKFYSTRALPTYLSHDIRTEWLRQKPHGPRSLRSLLSRPVWTRRGAAPLGRPAMTWLNPSWPWRQEAASGVLAVFPGTTAHEPPTVIPTRKSP